jgi:hypothetical protein
MNNLKTELKSSEKATLQLTENQAVGYVTSGKNLVDINFKISSYRTNSQNLIYDFDKAFHEDKNLAVKWLFFARDVREGLGERDLFQKVFSHLISTHKSKNIEYLLSVIPEFGRWKDIFDIFEIIKDTKYEKFVIEMIKNQLETDLKAMAQNKSTSLMPKWMPRENTSSKSRVHLARYLQQKLGMKPSEYRKKIASLNKFLNTTEVLLSAKDVKRLDYERIPSLANLKYKNTFLRIDEERRREYLEKLSKGEAKMNMSVGYPHDIVHAYMKDQRFMRGSTRFNIDEALEGAWKNLKSLNLSNTIVIGDSSGSMCAVVGNTQVQALEVAHALGIYCGDHNTGPFKNKMITFSRTPKYLEWKDEDTLAAKLGIAFGYSEVANTNIEAVFELILKTAIKNHCKQDEIPGTILIISDMEFDSATDGRTDRTLFDSISEKYEKNGYKLPKICFWNVCGRSNTVPMQENENGVALVSGFSVNTIKLVTSGQLDPFLILKEVLEQERYKNIIWE